MINETIRKEILKSWKPKKWKPIDENYLKIFKSSGEGLYYINIKSSGSGLVSKLIGFFCHGFVHTVMVLYKENLNEYLKNNMETDVYYKIIDGLKLYYLECNINQINCLVISSSDSIGQTCLDVSNYQNRKQTIRKITKISDSQEKGIVNFLGKQLRRPYDYTGLFGYPIKWISKFVYKFFDSKYYFCSEICQAACSSVGIKIANENPTPYDIEKYNAFPKVYDNIKIKPS